MKVEVNERIKGLRCMVGNTPLLAVDFEFRGDRRVVYAKAENLNLTGSIKDRMAFHILNQGYKSGALQPGDKIIEATSGNTGISFAAIGRSLGHPVTIFMPDWMSNERINLIKSLGAEIVLVSKEEGGFLGSIELAEKLARSEKNTFLPRQFSNTDNIDAHKNTTGPEIWWQMRFHSLIPDAFIAGVGTGGTIMGTGNYLKKQNPDIKIHPLEPLNSPTLSTGYKVGKHRIQGISDEFIPSIVKLETLDDVIGVDDGDSIIMAQKLSNQLGIGVGISSGANFLGAIHIQNILGNKASVVTIFPDDNKKYLSTDLLKDEPVKENFISSEVKLLGYRGFKRVCYTCCDPSECAGHEKENPVGVSNPLPHCSRRV